MRFLRIEIFTRIERNQALTAVGDAVAGCSGWIVSHQLFSNLSATINIEVPVSNAEDLLSRLEKGGFSPKLEGEMPRSLKHKAEEEVRGTISLTFIHDDPDMKRDVPAFG